MKTKEKTIPFGHILLNKNIYFGESSRIVSHFTTIINNDIRKKKYKNTQIYTDNI